MPLAARLGLVLACLFWAVSFVATKVALETIPPLAIVTLRLLVSAACFVAWFAARGSWPRPAAGVSWRRLLGVSLLGTTLHYGPQTVGLQWTKAANGALYAATCPVLIALTAWAVAGERPSPRKAAGIALALAGVLVVMGLDAVRGLDVAAGLLIGDALVLASIFTWALFTVVGKDVAARLGALEMTGVVTIVGALTMVPAGWLELHARGASLAAVPARGWAAVAFLGVTCSFLATLLYVSALRHGDSRTVGVYLYTIPPMTAMAEWLVLGVPAGANLAAGAALVLAGVWLTERG